MSVSNFGHIEGRLTRDVEVRTGENGKAYAYVNLAVNRNYKNKDGNYDTDFLSFVAYDKTAEFIANNFGKGDGISFNYSLFSANKKDENGKNITVERKRIEGASFPVGGKRAAASQDAAPVAKVDPDTEVIDMTDDDDDLPF